MTAEFRESERGRVIEGENAGDYTGENHLKRVQTFKWHENRFVVSDKTQAVELADILAKAQAERDKGAKAKSTK